MFNLSNLSISNFLVIKAHDVGYRVDMHGNVLNPKNIKINPFVCKNQKYKYLRFSIREKSISKCSKSIMVHRLQAYQKFGNLIFDDNIQVRHLNNNSQDNSWNNIEIGTAKENAMDKFENVRKNAATIASRKMQDNCRSYSERCSIYDDLKDDISYNKIMLKHNISSKGTLSFMKNKSIEFKEYIGIN